MNLASRRPLALVVHHAHWADSASLRFLAYVGRRLQGLPILLLVAARPRGQPGGRAVAELLAKDDADGALRPAPLSEAGAARLVRAALPDAQEALCRACREVTGGNPFFLREVTMALREADTTRADDVLNAAPDGVVAGRRRRRGRRLVAPALSSPVRLPGRMGAVPRPGRQAAELPAAGLHLLWRRRPVPAQLQLLLVGRRFLLQLEALLGPPRQVDLVLRVETMS